MMAVIPIILVSGCLSHMREYDCIICLLQWAALKAGIYLTDNTITGIFPLDVGGNLEGFTFHIHL